MAALAKHRGGATAAARSRCLPVAGPQQKKLERGGEAVGGASHAPWTQGHAPEQHGQNQEATFLGQSGADGKWTFDLCTK